MNERIRQLAEQAKHETSLYGGKPGDNDFDKLYNQKFAELIVNECANRLLESDFNDFKGVMYIAGLRLKKHFGVEL